MSRILLCEYARLSHSPLETLSGFTADYRCRKQLLQNRLVTMQDQLCAVHFNVLQCTGFELWLKNATVRVQRTS